MKRLLLPLLPLLLAAAASPPLPRTVVISEDDYPEAARQAGVEGDVEFDLMVDAKGNNSACQVTLGADLEANLAADTCAFALRRWHFAPARDETGKKVAGRQHFAIAWRIALPCPHGRSVTYICVSL